MKKLNEKDLKFVRQAVDEAGDTRIDFESAVEELENNRGSDSWYTIHGKYFELQFELEDTHITEVIAYPKEVEPLFTINEDDLEV